MKRLLTIFSGIRTEFTKAVSLGGIRDDSVQVFAMAYVPVPRGVSGERVESRIDV